MKRAIATHRANRQLGTGAVTSTTAEPPLKRPRVSDEVTGTSPSVLIFLFIRVLLMG
jgi:hypothetical protein